MIYAKTIQDAPLALTMIVDGWEKSTRAEQNARSFASLSNALIAEEIVDVLREYLIAASIVIAIVALSLLIYDLMIGAGNGENE